MLMRLSQLWSAVCQHRFRLRRSRSLWIEARETSATETTCYAAHQSGADTPHSKHLRQSLAGGFGRQFCTPSPPNLGALTALFEFTNPARQPALKNTKGFPQAYEGMISGQCVAAVLQIKLFEKLDKEKQLAKVLFQSKGLPNQAFSASSRISDEMRVRLSTALLSDEGKKATLKLRQEYNGQDFVLATVAEYQGHSVLLKDTWGFSH